MYTDDNGIVRFEATDNVSPLHIGLNTAMGSVSNSMAVVYSATVVSMSPLSIQIDGESAPYDGAVIDTVGQLAVGDDIRALVQQGTATVVGRVGGPTRVGTTDTRWVGIEGNGQLSSTTYAMPTQSGVSQPGIAGAQFPLVVARREEGYKVRLERLTGTIHRDYLPYRIASGRVSITPSAADTPTSLVVTFPTGRFTEAPMVIPGMGSSVAGTTAKGVGVTGISTTSCRLWFTRSNLTTTSIYWVAVQA